MNLTYKNNNINITDKIITISGANKYIIMMRHFKNEKQEVVKLIGKHMYDFIRKEIEK